jgi:mxaJ protein
MSSVFPSDPSLAFGSNSLFVSRTRRSTNRCTADQKTRSAVSILRWAVLLLALVAGTAEAGELRICADPNNLPFSNERREGFENKLAELLAEELGVRAEYTWWAQRRGFIRNTLKAGLCDLVMGMPAGAKIVRTTVPYYRSSYVFVTRAEEPAITSLDDPRLRELRIGVQLIGDDSVNTPPGHALASRGIISNVRGYTVYGDYREPNPPARIVTAVALGEIDVAVAWGPLAGYFARSGAKLLHLTPVQPAIDRSMLPMVFDIAIGVRREDEVLRQELDVVLRRRRSDIDGILDRYGVPRVGVDPPLPEPAG